MLCPEATNQVILDHRSHKVPSVLAPGKSPPPDIARPAGAVTIIFHAFPDAGSRKDKALDVPTQFTRNQMSDPLPLRSTLR